MAPPAKPGYKTPAPQAAALADEEGPGDANDSGNELEEAQFRMDELERALASIKDALDPQTLMGFFTGAATAMQAQLRSEMQALRAAQDEDAATDREVIAELKDVCAALKELCACLSAPVQRTSTVNLPSGPVEVSVRETRQYQ